MAITIPAMGTLLGYHETTVAFTLSMEGTFQASQFGVQIRQLRMPQGLTVDEVNISGSEIQVTPNPFDWSVAESAQIEIKVSAASMRDLILSKSPDQVKGIEVTLGEDRIWVKAQVKMLIVVNGSAELALKVEDGKRLLVELKGLDAIAGTARPMLEAQIASMNPILDTGTFPFPLKITSCLISDGWLILDGTVPASKTVDARKIGQ